MFNSLVYWNLLNFVRNCGYTLFFTNNALYRNAYDNMRHILESIIQALYLDSKHPILTIEIKIHILSEVEDNREYHVLALLHKLNIGHKERIKKIYQNLSKRIHPTVETVKSIFEDYLRKDKMPTQISCDEIKTICVLMREIIDIFFFLYVSNFQECKVKLTNNNQFIDYVKKYKLYLIPKALKIKTTT